MPLMPGAEPWSHDGGPVGVLLIHGFTSTPASMKDWGAHLADAGYTVDIPRLPGHGTRWQDLNLTRWEDWYSEVERSFDRLKATCDTVFVMGLSMGGSLSLRLAEQRGDDVAGLVIVNPAVHSEHPLWFALPVLRLVVPAFPGIASDVKKAGVEESAYDKTPLKAVYSLSQLWGLVKQDIAKVTQPVLLYRSAEDHVVEPSNGAWLMSHLPGTDVTEVVLTDSYHVATIDNEAETVFAGSVEFMNRVAPAPRTRSRSTTRRRKAAGS